MSEGIVVRVVKTAEQRLYGWLVAVPMGLLTGAILLGMVDVRAVFEDRYWSFSLACAAWCLGLILTWRPRPRIARVTGEAQRLGLHIRGEGLTTNNRDLSVWVARAERGYSIAIGRARAPSMFLEVERESDARRLLAQLGVTWPGTSGGAAMTMPNALLRWVRWGIGFLGMVSALLYGIVVAGFDSPDYKGIFGLPAITSAIIASVLFVGEPLFRRRLIVGRDTLPGRSAVAEHTRLHVLSSVTGVTDEKDPSTESSEANTDDARTKILDRAALHSSNEETTRAWIARLDTLGSGGAGYRGDAFTSDELRSIAENKSASMAARLGALRVLARRSGGVPEDLRARVAEEIGSPRVRIILEAAEPDQAAEQLDEIGPAFRARAD